MHATISNRRSFRSIATSRSSSARLPLLLVLLAFGTSSLSWAFAPAAQPLTHRPRGPASSTSRITRSTRTCTSTSALQAFALDSAASAVEGFFISQPYVSAFLTCSFKASAADWVAQTTQSTSEDEEEEAQKTLLAEKVTAVVDDASSSTMDVSRNVAFLLYGGLYQGMAQNFIYNTLFPNWFGSAGDLASLTYQVAFDMLIIGPFLCLPVAYIVKDVFANNANENENDKESFAQNWYGLDKYVEDVTTRGLLYKYWALWTPVQYLTFGVIPPHFRVAFVAFISFFWVCILSSVAAASADPSSEEAIVAAVTGASEKEDVPLTTSGGGGGWGLQSFTSVGPPLSPTPAAQRQEQESL